MNQRSALIEGSAIIEGRAMNQRSAITKGSAVSHGHAINQPTTPAVVSTMYSIKCTPVILLAKNYSIC